MAPDGKEVSAAPFAAEMEMSEDDREMAGASSDASANLLSSSDPFRMSNDLWSLFFFAGIVNL
jgi:hypothetical protein